MLRSAYISIAALSVACLVTSAAHANAKAASPEGYWKTVGDDGGRPQSVVKIWVEDGKAYGRIVKLFRKPDEPRDPVCKKCEGPKKNKRVVGLTVLEGLEREDGEWTGGSILDPANGETYNCFIEVLDGGEKLKVRGYVGFSLFGRTQHWHRVDKPENEIEIIK